MLWPPTLRLAAQTPARLELMPFFVDGLPTLGLTAEPGSVYSFQHADDLSPTTVWAEWKLFRVNPGLNVWSDPNARFMGRMFYRAVLVPRPLSTNLVFIQPGTFIMGSPTNAPPWVLLETPQMLVTITRGFWMTKYPVTQGDYLAVVGSNPSYFNGVRNGTDFGTNLARPVETVTWDDATNYCGLLTAHERAVGKISVNLVYRLPTEAEWEYACRAGTTTMFYYGDDQSYIDLTNYAWYGGGGGVVGNSGGVTHPVGQKLPNPWGLYDMGGNAAEWCSDWWAVYAGGIVIDPQQSVNGNERVMRGGSWYQQAIYCQSATRGAYPPSVAASYIGFRPVLASTR